MLTTLVFWDYVQVQRLSTSTQFVGAYTSILCQQWFSSVNIKNKREETVTPGALLCSKTITESHIITSPLLFRFSVFEKNVFLPVFLLQKVWKSIPFPMFKKKRGGGEMTKIVH